MHFFLEMTRVRAYWIEKVYFNDKKQLYELSYELIRLELII